MSFSVTILGSSSAKPTLSRHPSAQAVNVHEQYYLVDAGEGVPVSYTHLTLPTICSV